MTATILLITLAGAIGIFHDTNKPTQYELQMEDGSKTKVILQKNNKYACPLYCGVDHIHRAVMCKDNNQIKNNQYVYHISKENEFGASLYCSTKKILSMSRFTTSTKKNLPDVVNASKEK